MDRTGALVHPCPMLLVPRLSISPLSPYPFMHPLRPILSPHAEMHSRQTSQTTRSKGHAHLDTFPRPIPLKRLGPLWHRHILRTRVALDGDQPRALRDGREVGRVDGRCERVDPLSFQLHRWVEQKRGEQSMSLAGCRCL